jgi:hypothetical protein
MNLPEMTPEQWAWIEARDRRDAFEATVLADYEAEPAGATAKERLVNFIKWKNDTAAELAKLKEQRQRLQATTDAPAEFTAKRTSLLRTLATKLLGGDETSNFDLLEARALDSEIDAAQRRADVAKLALAQLDEKIEIKTLQLNRLRDREAGFAELALLEYATEKLGARYRAAIAELRDVATQLDGARQVGGRSGFKAFALPSLGALSDNRDAWIAPDGAAQESWRQWLADQGAEVRRRRFVQPSY